MEQLDREFVPQPGHPGLEAMEAGFCMVDSLARVTYWNPAAERLLGAGRERVLGRPVWEVLPFLRRAATWDRIRHLRPRGEPLRFVEPLEEGGRVMSVRATPLADGGLAVEFRDATGEVKRSRQYAALLESIRDGFLAVDERWRITYLNAVAESLLHFPRDRALGLTLWSLLPAEPREIAQCLRDTMQDGVQRHLREVRPDARVFQGRVFDLWTHRLAEGGICVFFEDVSDRVQRERQLGQLAAEATDANRAKTRFFAAISHELRTPLNAIIGYTHLLNTETYGAMPPGARRAAERAGVCAEHLARLVDDVLLLTTTETGRLPVTPEWLNLAQLLPAALEPLRLQAEAKGLEFRISVAPDLPRLETDPQRLRQLLLALVTNAVKFTTGGSVSVVAGLHDPLPEPGRRPEGYRHSPGPEVEITVSDTGPGVEPEHRERIFGAFEQLGDPARSDSMNQGTGLGLTVARQLARLLHGSLEIAETSPAGSRFSLRLPVAFAGAAGHPRS